MREPDEPRINPTDQPMLEILMSNVDGPQAAAFSGAAPWAGKVGRPGGVDRAATLVDYGDAAMLDIDAMLGTPAAGEPKQRTARAASNGEVVSSPETLADVERTASPSSRTFSDSEDSLGTRNGSSGSGGRWNGANSASASPAEPVPLPVFAIPAPQDFSFPLGVSTVSPGTLDSMPGVYSEGGLSIFAPVPTLPGSPRKIKTPRRGTPGGAAAALASIPAPRPFSPASVAQSSGLAGLAPDVDRESALATLKGQLDAARGVPTLSRSIRVLGVPSIGAKSRVETQIKVCLQLVAPSGSSSDWTQLRIPEHMLASRDRQKRSRAAGSDMDAEQDGILDLQAEVICASEPSRQVMVCATCMQREVCSSGHRRYFQVTNSFISLTAQACAETDGSGQVGPRGDRRRRRSSTNSALQHQSIRRFFRRRDFAEQDYMLLQAPQRENRVLVIFWSPCLRRHALIRFPSFQPVLYHARPFRPNCCDRHFSAGSHYGRPQVGVQGTHSQAATDVDCFAFVGWERGGIAFRERR